MRKLFIADPALTNHQGHHFSVTNSFSKFAESRGYDVIWLVNKGFHFKPEDRSSGYRIHRTFSNSTYDAFKKKETFPGDKGIKGRLRNKLRKLPESVKAKIRSIVGFISVVTLKINHMTRRRQGMEPSENTPIKEPKAFQELYEAVCKYRTGQNDIVLFHTCDAHTYADIVQLFVEAIGVLDWNSFPMLHLSTPYDDLVMPHNKTAVPCQQSVGYLDAMGLVNSRVFLYAENELLAEYWRNQWSVDVKSLYIPQQATQVQNVEGSKLNVAYLGAARTEKGFPIVSEAVMKFLVNNDRTDVTFTLQVSPQIMGYTADIQYAVKKLKAFDDKRMRLIETVQTPAEYEELLVKSNVLLLCYDQKRYEIRSSGIVIEALANEKNVIATKGSFPEFIAAEAGIGVESVDDVVIAISKIANEREKYHQRAKERSEVFLSTIASNGMDKLLQKKGDNCPFVDAQVGKVVGGFRDSAVTLKYMQLI